MLHQLYPIADSYSLLADKQLVTDSRQLLNPTQSVFFALKGRQDGHTYIPNLYQQGVRFFVVNSQKYEKADWEKNCPDAHFFVTEDVLAGLQFLVAYHRRNFHIPIVAITGSNGKTIIKEWLGQLLSHEYKVVKSPKSYNSQIGVPLSVWQLNDQHEIGIFEAGISTVGEMPALQGIIRPTIGIFTNIGQAHDEGFSSRAEKIREKLALFTQCKLLIYNSDYTQIEDELLQWQTDNPEVTLFSWGFSPLADLQIVACTLVGKKTEMIVLFRDTEYKITVPFTEKAFVENSLHCVALLLTLGWDWAKIEAHLQELKPIQMRLELKQGVNNCLLIDDTYNNDWAGLMVALNFLNQHQQKTSNTVILSDMYESGLPAEQLYEQIAVALEEKKIDRLIGIGEVIKEYAAIFNIKDKIFFTDKHHFLQNYRQKFLTFQQENILVKGARRFGFEEIVKELQAKIHGTVLTINLEALAHNLNYYRSLLPQNTKIMVMVKAFAYGSGSFEVARLLQYHRVDYLAVAYTDEGVALRQNGITLPIMVMNPSPETFNLLIQYNLEPEIYSHKILSEWISYLDEIQINQPLAIHLKIDTGMHRLGFEQEDIDVLAYTLTTHQNKIQVASIFTHLAGADAAEFDDFSAQQVRIFQTIAHSLENILGYQPLKHAFNSAGIVRFLHLPNSPIQPEQLFDNQMVRLGIGLYGVEANQLLQAQLKTVGALKTVISQIKNVKAGETVGYSRKGQVNRESRVATIAIGYADGFSRKMSNGVGKVLVNNELAPVVGNVCMDMTMIDVTGIDCAEGDEVIIFGEQLPITEVATWIGTIPYEILTSVGERVKRVFYSE